MYAGGAEDPFRAPCRRILSLVEQAAPQFVTNVEVFQEIIHRYKAINRWQQGRQLFQEFATLMIGRIESVHAIDIITAAQLADRYAGLSARDLLHAAVMRRLGVVTIASTDSRFDQIDGIERLDPMLVDQWANTVSGAT
jgi:predicted nucleic acid-binding protein